MPGTLWLCLINSVHILVFFGPWKSCHSLFKPVTDVREIVMVNVGVLEGGFCCKRLLFGTVHGKSAF